MFSLKVSILQGKGGRQTNPTVILLGEAIWKWGKSRDSWAGAVPKYTLVLDMTVDIP